MDATRALGWLAVGGLAAALGGLAVSLATTNGLLGSEWTAPALVTLGIVESFLLGLYALGREDSRWRRTPYW